MGETPGSRGTAAVPSWLATALRTRVGADGFVPFDALMDAALYASGGGYYATDPSPFGPNGDFYTAPHVHPLFGATVARRIVAEFERLGRPSDFVIAELGCGDGALARDIATALAKWDERERWPYFLIDRSVPLRAAAAERLRQSAPSGLLAPRESPTLGALGPLTGVVVANELLDALPFRRFRRRGSQWEELGVRLAGEGVEPAVDPTPRPVPTVPLPPSAEDGTIVELNTVAEALVREVGDHLTRGVAIFLDFGDEERALLHTRSRGTWTAVSDHRVVDDPLTSIGTADQSVYVNFTRLRSAGARSGLVESSFRPQREALAEWGFESARNDAAEAAVSEEEKLRLHFAAKKLLFGFEQFWAWELRPPVRTGG